MREIFAPRDNPPDPGRVFYTIRQEDVGKSIIDTEIGPIHLVDVMIRVLKHDVGKRLYRVPNNAGDMWLWIVENDAQFKERTEKQEKE